MKHIQENLYARITRQNTDCKQLRLRLSQRTISLKLPSFRPSSWLRSRSANNNLKLLMQSLKNYSKNGQTMKKRKHYAEKMMSPDRRYRERGKIIKLMVAKVEKKIKHRYLHI